jgi:hypothetical protein
MERTKHSCPECAVTLKNPLQCRCGWEKQHDPEIDWRCHYQFNNERCPLAGTMVEGLKNKKWLCRAHYLARQEPALSRAILMDVKQNFSVWNAKRKDWRILLLEEKLKLYSDLYKGKNTSMDEYLSTLKKKILNEE